MDTTTDAALPVLPVETAEFSANPNPFLEAARTQHPWLARFSQGYIVHGYPAIVELLADSKNLVSGFGGILDFYGVRGTMWARFMQEMVISRGGPEQIRPPKRANREREMMQRVISALLDEWAPKGAFDFAEFASFFPVTVICGLLGVSAEPIPRMRQALDNQLT